MSQQNKSRRCTR